MASTPHSGQEGTETGTDVDADLDARDVRALTEVMTVLDDQGRVKDVDGLYEVVTAGGTYLVDTHDDTCECPDAQYHTPVGGCKHQRRVAFATGERAIPDWIDTDADALDDDFGRFVAGSPRFEGERADEDTATPAPTATGREAVATDGGQLVEVRNENEDEENTDGGDDEEDAETEDTDYWGQPIRHYEDPCYGAGERGECQICGSHHIRLYAATAPPANGSGSNDQFEEFYECDCGATGSFRSSQRGPRTWTGSIRYPGSEA